MAAFALPTVAVALLGIGAGASGGLSRTNVAQLCFTLPLLGVFPAALLLRSAKPGTSLNRIFSIAPLTFFGRISYGLYVFHSLLRSELRVILWQDFGHLS